MTVEMNTPSAFRIIRDSANRNTMGAPEREDIDRPLSDDIDIYSLNSWTETLSTSSSSDSASYHPSSSSRHSGKQRVGRSKPKSTIRKALPVERTQINAHNSGRTGSKFSSNNKQFEFESSAVAVPTTNHHNYSFEGCANDSDISAFNICEQYDTVDGDGLQYQPRNPITVNTHNDSEFNKTSIVNGDEKITNNYKDKTGSDTPKHMETLDTSKFKAQRLYPDLEEMKRLYSDGNDLAISQSASSSLGNEEVNNRPQQTEPQTQRRSYFDFHKLPNFNSRNSKTQSSETNSGPHRTFSSLPRSNNIPVESSDISRKQFDKYKAKDGRVFNNNTAPLLGRLHKSQPSIASEPHLKRQPKSSNDLESLRLSFEHRLEAENVKTKVKSVWNNIKYGWIFQSKSSFKCDSPLFILGKCYHRQKDDLSTDVEDQFLRDFVSRIWFTYRSNFYPIPGTKLSTDCGWGCMLRSGQMLVAQCLVTHFLGRDWRLYDKQTDTQSVYYREIIRWFSDPVDTLSDKTPFCLHHLASFGRTYNKDPGEWYGPASVAYIFRDAFTKASHIVPILSQLCIYVAQDCTVYIEDVIKMCTTRQKSESVSSITECEAGAVSSRADIQSGKWQRSLIILIPIRLGGELMNDIYIPCVQSLLSQDNCMGIIGGKPKHSLYFIGWQDDKLIYLDPHLCREAVDTSVSDFRIESYHCMTPRKLPINKMDPSCTVGFFVRDEDDFKKFVKEVRGFVSPPKQKGGYPLFIFADGHLNETQANHSDVDRHVRVTHYRVDQNGQRHRTFSDNSEEFVLL